MADHEQVPPQDEEPLPTSTRTALTNDEVMLATAYGLGGVVMIVAVSDLIPAIKALTSAVIGIAASLFLLDGARRLWHRRPRTLIRMLGLIVGVLLLLVSAAETWRHHRHRRAAGTVERELSVPAVLFGLAGIAVLISPGLVITVVVAALGLAIAGWLLLQGAIYAGLLDLGDSARGASPVSLIFLRAATTAPSTPTAAN
ncbi:MAG: hypothetical protein ACK5H2_04455 [Beutenbergiaceae bacterium]